MKTLVLILLLMAGCTQGLQSRIDALEQENTALSAQLGVLEQQNAALSTQVEALQAEQTAEAWAEERECILDLMNHAPYAKGSIIVSFPDGTSEEEAEGIIISHGLSVRRLGQLFDVNPWGTVYVPEGREIEWVCRLRLDDRIKSASLDEMVSIN